MKNIHLLPTDKPSRLYYSGNNLELLLSKHLVSFRTFDRSTQHIYITSDEEIKDNDYITDGYLVWKWKDDSSLLGRKKIILTTDQDLIADGVQAIPDEFLEWFVKNPSCEEVEVKSEILYEHKDTYRPYPSECKNLTKTKVNYYLSIIPKEEPKQDLPQLGTKEFNDLASAYFGGKPKQETLEKVAENEASIFYEKGTIGWNKYRQIFKDGAKWQAERMYSEEEVRNAIDYGANLGLSKDIGNSFEWKRKKDLWFEQFKKK
jgi:hypothetical protein